VIRACGSSLRSWKVVVVARTRKEVLRLARERLGFDGLRPGSREDVYTAAARVLDRLDWRTR
jgi:hypothetical protein